MFHIATTSGPLVWINSNFSSGTSHLLLIFVSLTAIFLTFCWSEPKYNYYYPLGVGISVLISKKKLVTGLCPQLKSNIPAIEPAFVSSE